MNNNGPIVVIDDDTEDHEIISMAYKTLNITNELKIFSNGTDAIDYIRRQAALPLFILSDINMPLKSGFEIRETLQHEGISSIKQIPFVFWSTTWVPSLRSAPVIDCSQGFFLKPASYRETAQLLSMLIEYWSRNILF